MYFPSVFVDRAFCNILRTLIWRTAMDTASDITSNTIIQLLRLLSLKNIFPVVCEMEKSLCSTPRCHNSFRNLTQIGKAI